MERRHGGSRFSLLAAAVCGMALVVLLDVSSVADGACPTNQCDFYCSKTPGEEIPFIRLFKNGDHEYPCNLKHKIGGQRLRVKVANSYNCSLAMPKKSQDSKDYEIEPCHHTLYTNGDDVASRTFNWGPEGDGKFLKNCIKIYIGSAQYRAGGNYNEGLSNPKSCVMVETGRRFKDE